MSYRPISIPSIKFWATNGGVTLDPTAGLRATGWSDGDRVPARYLNFLQNAAAGWGNAACRAAFSDFRRQYVHMLDSSNVANLVTTLVGVACIEESTNGENQIIVVAVKKADIDPTIGGKLLGSLDGGNTWFPSWGGSIAINIGRILWDGTYLWVFDSNKLKAVDDILGATIATLAGTQPTLVTEEGWNYSREAGKGVCVDFSGTTVYYTTDITAGWTAATSFPTITPSYTRLRGIECDGDATWIMVVREPDATDDAAIIISTDGGINWDFVSDDAGISAADGDIAPSSTVYEPTTGTWWIAAVDTTANNALKLYKSTDGGDVWVDATPSYFADVPSDQFTNFYAGDFMCLGNGILILCNQTNTDIDLSGLGDTDTVYDNNMISYDAGVTWERMRAPYPHIVQMDVCRDGSIVMVGAWPASAARSGTGAEYEVVSVSSKLAQELSL